MNRLRCLLVCLSILAAPSPGQDFNKGGRTAMQFLKIGIGARHVGLGESAIANVRDVNSVFWNPAGISGISGVEASFSYSSWFVDMNYMAGAVGFRAWDLGVFAVSYAWLDYGDIPEALVQVVGSGASDTRTGNVFTGGDLLAAFSYTREFTDQLAIGVSVKFLQEKLFVHSVDLLAFDVGTHFDTKYNGIKIAMAAQNFSGAVKWLPTSDREEGYDIPLLFRIGTSVNLVHGSNGFVDAGEQHEVMVTADALHTNDYAERYHLGVEYSYRDFLYLRGGHKFNYEDGAWSAGFGLVQHFYGATIAIDYAFVNFRYLESPHRLTVSMRY